MEIQTKNKFDFDYFRKNFEALLERFHLTENLDFQNELLNEINSLRFAFEAEKNRLTLRHVQNYHDSEAEKEYNSLISQEAKYQHLVKRYYELLLLSPHKKELEKRWGRQLFRIAELKVQSYSDEILEEIKLENRLMGEYGKLLGTGKVVFQGEEMGLSFLAQYMMSADREIRKAAYEARARYFAENEERFDEILDELIKVRTRIACKLGRSNFIELGYERMNRTDISPRDMESYRIQVKRDGVPFVSSLRKIQKDNLRVNTLKYFDDKMTFLDGPPPLRINRGDFLDKMKVLFAGLSTETEMFYDSLIKKGNHDLLPRTGKRGGGYATYLGEGKEPFIFANISGVSNDVRLFTHEAGHAFQFFMSSEMNCPEYMIPVDSAEIFSFAMERFAWPWMKEFFGEDANKYKFTHLIEAFMYMPFASAIDEFEHFLYENPDAGINERKQKWRELEGIYQPELDYDGNKYLEAGGGFHGIAHLYFSPFYFIDYDIAHILAVQLWEKSLRDHESAWKTYLEMCKAGGSRSLKEHIEAAGLKSPFEEDSLSEVLIRVRGWMEEALSRY
ncbi:M3 family oligoendopeptidase [Bacillus salacetis]|uniref:M3 family oligoendopeptidase n=1 Tax=Bacillus salacetis TaxID=2315464 RepID=UPI003B9E3F06